MYHMSYGVASSDGPPSALDAEIAQVDAQIATAPPASQPSIMARRRNLIRQRQALADKQPSTITTPASRAQFQAAAQARRQARRQATYDARRSARQEARAAAAGRRAAYRAQVASRRQARRRATRAQYFAARRAARRQARIQAATATAPSTVTPAPAPSGGLIGSFFRGGRLIRYWTRRAYPVGVPLLQSGMAPIAAATQAIAQVGVPVAFRARVRRRLRLRYRRLRLTPAFVAAVQTATPTTVAVTPATPTPAAFTPIPNYMIQSGAFRTYPSPQIGPSMMPAPRPMAPAAPAAPAAPEGEDDLLDEDFLLEDETPFYKKPLFLAIAGIGGYYYYTNVYKKKGK